MKRVGRCRSAGEGTCQPNRPCRGMVLRSRVFGSAKGRPPRRNGHRSHAVTGQARTSPGWLSKALRR